MDKQPGTLDVIALELAKVVKPLEERIKKGEILELFAELGIRFPDSLANNPQFGAALADAIARLEVIPGLITTLIDQVEAEVLPEGKADMGYIGDQPTEGPYPGPDQAALAHLAGLLDTLKLAPAKA